MWVFQDAPSLMIIRKNTEHRGADEHRFFSLAKSGQVAIAPFHDSRTVTFWEPWNRYPSVHKGYWGQWRSHEGTGVDELIWAKNKMCGSSAGGLRKADIGGWYENFTRNEILPSFRTVPVQKKNFFSILFFFFFFNLRWIATFGHPYALLCTFLSGL